MAHKSQILRLYKNLMKESQKFTSYNFRFYAVRRVRDAFKENKQLTDSHVVNDKIEEAYRSLEMIKRQALITQMYQSDELVIEKMHQKC